MIKFEVKKVKQVVAHSFFLFLKFAHLPLSATDSDSVSTGLRGNAEGGLVIGVVATTEDRL